MSASGWLGARRGGWCGGAAAFLILTSAVVPSPGDGLSPLAGGPPALLILRVRQADAPATPRVDLLRTRLLGSWPMLQAVQLEHEIELRDGVPDPGDAYQLDQAITPATGGTGERYYFYHLDLSDPTVIRNWQAMRRAAREEARQAAAEERNVRQWHRRKLQLLRANAQASEAGIAALREGKYREALLSLTRAADLDQGDPICRIHLVQARIALGHDAEAARVLRRALELQPKLVALRLNLETYYPEPGVFDDHVNALQRRVQRRRSNPAELHFLLGFLQFQRGRYDDAYEEFARIAPVEPRDEYVEKFLDLTRPASR